MLFKQEVDCQSLPRHDKKPFVFSASHKGLPDILGQKAEEDAVPVAEKLG